jgi:flagellar hook protein FlgE
MFSGVSGLRVHQTKMDVIGNNIANVNTVGFKSGRVTFNEIFYQTLQGASGANEATGRAGTNPMQVGLGVNVASIDTLMTEGAAQRTDNPLDLKIEGEGFFIVNDGTGYKFTRAGAFIIDHAGNLATPGGLKVLGWQTNAETGEIERGEVSPLQIMSPANMYADPAMTEFAYIEGNIDKNDPQLLTGVPFTVGLYDSLGYRYTAEFTVQFTNIDPTTGTATNENQYTITFNDVKDSNGNSIGTGAGTVDIEFDPATGKLANTSNQSVTITGLDTDFSEFADLEIDLSQLTMFAGKTSLQSVRGNLDGQGAGREAGSMASFAVGPDGIISATYTNGETRKLGQIALAQFANPAGLLKVGNNLFQATQNSGEFDGIGVDPTASGGSLNGGVLEMSNVDLAKEFTEMITAQRGFQANSRIITSSDEMLQELVNLKR